MPQITQIYADFFHRFLLITLARLCRVSSIFFTIFDSVMLEKRKANTEYPYFLTFKVLGWLRLVVFFGIIMLLMIFFGGCKNKEEQLQCLEEQIAKHNENQEYENLKIAVADSIKKWSQQGLQYTSSYNDSNSIWKVDEILFNEDKSKLFGWLLKVDKEQVADIPKGEDRNDILDYVEYFTGEKREGKWYFYIHNMPSVWFAREDNNSQPYSFEYLSKSAKEEVVKGGVFKKGTCEMNYSYINEWIDREGRELYKWHQEFLKSKDDD